MTNEPSVAELEQRLKEVESLVYDESVRDDGITRRLRELWKWREELRYAIDKAKAEKAATPMPDDDLGAAS